MKINLTTMSRSDLVELARDIVTEAISAEDPGDFVTWVCDRFGVKPNGDLDQIAEPPDAATVPVPALTGPDSDWTMRDGRANSSKEFIELGQFVGEIISCSAHDLIAGRANKVGHLIMAQLAHVKGLRPASAVVMRTLVAPPEEGS